MKTLVIALLSVSAILTSCKPALEDKATMHKNAKRVSDSIEHVIDSALNSVSITPVPAQLPADTARK